MPCCKIPSPASARAARGTARLGAALLLLFGIALLTRAEVPVPEKSSDVARSEAIALDKKIIAQVKDNPDLMPNLTYLSDRIGARLTGSANLKRANEWAAEKMKSYGLSNVHLEPWTIPVAWERGVAYARIIEPDTGRSLLIASMGWSPSTKGRVQGEVVVIKARNSQDLAAYKGKLKNAIVLQGAPSNVRTNFSPLSPDGRRGRRGGDGGAPGANGRGTAPAGAGKAPAAGAGNPQPSGFRRDVADFQQRMAFRRELSDFLRAEGAACILLDAGKPQGLLNMTGNWRGEDRVSAAEPLPSAFVAHEHYALLYRLTTDPVLVHPRVEIELTNKLIPGPITVYNTIGEIKGSEKPDEVVVVGAHLDSWDLGQGTTDNGTGTCSVLETARTLLRAGVKPKRTIRFCLFTGEEQGLHGSREYVKAHKAEMPKVSLCLVHDTGTGKVIGIGTQGRDSIKPILEAELVSLKEIGLQEINNRSLQGSDHQSFEREGVPGFAVQQDMSEYNLTHHSQSDTLDKVHIDDLVEGVQVLAVTAVRVANLPNLLPRDKPTRPDGGRRGGRDAEAEKAAPDKSANKAATKSPAEKK
jgi:carboxypeptidase Q